MMNNTILIFILLICAIYLMTLAIRRNIKRDNAENMELLLKYKTIFENALIGIRLYDHEGYLIDANDLSCHIYGVTKEKLLKINNCIFDNPVFSKHICKENPKPFSGILENNYDELIQNPYFSLGLPHGLHYVDTRINPVCDEGGKLRFIVVTFRDVTDTVNGQKLLEIEKNKAMASDRLKSEFLSNMSHEIRTPLNAIVGFSDVMCKFDVKNEEMRECQQMINRNSKSLLNLINNILELSKIESGNVERVDKEFNLSEVFFSVYDSLKQQNPNPSEIDFTCRVPSLECLIIADKDRLRQLLIHMIHNAFKYTHKGYVKMSYEINPDGFTVIIDDSGEGIPKEKIDKIFNRFEKLDSFKPGTGLGLSICRAIVDDIGGKIDVKSEVGKGTTFYVWCPIETV